MQTALGITRSSHLQILDYFAYFPDVMLDKSNTVTIADM